MYMFRKTKQRQLLILVEWVSNFSSPTCETSVQTASACLYYKNMDLVHNFVHSYSRIFLHHNSSLKISAIKPDIHFSILSTFNSVSSDDCTGGESEYFKKGLPRRILGVDLWQGKAPSRPLQTRIIKDVVQRTDFSRSAVYLGAAPVTKRSADSIVLQSLFSLQYKR